MYRFLGRTRAALILLIGAAVFATGGAAASAQDAGPAVRFDRPAPGLLAVIGRDDGVTVEAQLPATCAGQGVAVGLYSRNGPMVLGPAEGTASVEATATGQVSIRATVALPAELPASLLPAWPGVSASCLGDAPVVSTSYVLFGLLDVAANGKDGATFVVPAAALAGPGGVPVTASLAAVVDGVTCATARTVDAASRDAAGNVRIRVGGPAQPLPCGRGGAEVRFRQGDGRFLFERRTLVLGVTQPLANLAPEAPGTGSPPLPPNTGAAASANAPGGASLDSRLGLAGLASVTGAVLFVLARRPHG